MVSNYHKNIQKATLEFGKYNPKKYYQVYTGDQKPIHIPSPMKKHREIIYKPDVIFKTKNRQIYIFEILDGQLRNTGEVIADVIESLMTPDISKLFFVVPTEDDKIIDNLIEISEVIIDTLDTVGFRNYPIFVQVISIIREKSRSIKSIKKILQKYSKNSKW